MEIEKLNFSKLLKIQTDNTVHIDSKFMITIKYNRN